MAAAVLPQTRHDREARRTGASGLFGQVMAAESAAETGEDDEAIAAKAALILEMSDGRLIGDLAN